MDGAIEAGWFVHPQNDLIRVFQSGTQWVYQCYSSTGTRVLSKERPLDSWTWALSAPADLPGLEEA